MNVASRSVGAIYVGHLLCGNMGGEHAVPTPKIKKNASLNCTRVYKGMTRM